MPAFNEMCPVCQRPVGSHRSQVQISTGSSDAVDVDCPQCGRFSATAEFIQGPASTLALSERGRLSAAIRRATDKGGRLVTVVSTANSDFIRDSGFRAAFPTDYFDHLLREIAARTEFPGDYTLRDSKAAWTARAALPTENQLNHLLAELDAMGLIKQIAGNEIEGHRFRLTSAGWSHLQNTALPAPEGNQAFVAMWFHTRLQAVYTDGIRPALEDTGYTPYRVDLAPHNNRIDDEIISQIRRSRLLVADVTGERGGVYFEAGLAMGLGIPVLWTCNRSWTTVLPTALEPESEVNPECATTTWESRVHFDTRQYHHIFWSDEVELRIRLDQRIRALGLAIARPSHYPD